MDDDKSISKAIAKNPGRTSRNITPELCKAYRETLGAEISSLGTEIVDLKENVTKINDRTWQILAGVIVSIALMLLSIAKGL